MLDAVSELAQKMYNDDGHAGNLYRTYGDICQRYENKAIDLLEKTGRQAAYQILSKIVTQHTGYTKNF